MLIAHLPQEPHVITWLRSIALLLTYTVLSIASINTLAEPQPQSTHYPKKIHFRDIMQNQDIALGEVEAIVQDYEGFMWLGGRNALLRYDGYEFLSIPIANKPDDLTQTSAVNQVLELLEDRQHNLWIGTRSGLFKYDRNREILLPIQNALFREAIIALAESPDGELLIGAVSGLYALNTQTLALTQIDHQRSKSGYSPNTIVSELLVDPHGTIWVGLDDGVMRMDWANKQQTLFVLNPAKPESIADNGIRTIAMDHHGNVWAGSDNGIYRLNPATGAIKHYQHDPQNPHSLADNVSRQVYVDRQGWVWTGSDAGGISLYDEHRDQFLRFQHREGFGHLSSNTIRRIYEDSIGNLWIGTYPSGVNIYDRSTSAITIYKKDGNLNQGLLANNVEGILEDKDGNLWIGAGGISRYNPKDETFTHYQHTNGSDSRVGATAILDGAIDTDGEIRFGSWAHSIQLYNAKQDRFDTVPADPTQSKRGAQTGTQLNDLMVWSIYEDTRKNLWIGTHHSGLAQFDKKTGIYRFYTHSNTDSSTPSSNLIWTSYEDSHGRFWVGTANGLNLMDRDKGTFKHYMPNPDNPRHLANGSVLAVNEDHKGRLWVGTDVGLHLYHPETDDFTRYGIADGFVDQGIRAIVEDQSGNLWLGTNNGVVMFNPDSKLVRNYTLYNGTLIGGIALGAALATRSGEIVFGSRTGLYIFNVDKLLINTQKPPVVLTDFRLFTQKVPLAGADKILTKVINQTEQITLDYKKTMLSFSFAALNYRDPEKNHYAFKLEGFDDQWREVGNQRTAFYTNLPAGKYQFHVKASNNDGIWNDEGRTLALTILPPPWKTWWAYCIYFSIAIGLLLFFVYIQHKKVLDEREANRLLEIKVTERTVELKHKNEELEQAYEQLEAISLSDPLTGLSNRRYLQKLIPMDIAKVQREYNSEHSLQPRKKPSLDLTFFIFDIDFFKSVNDTYGHLAGDTLLIQFSTLLTSICRESDCVVRWGGEEFLIVSRFIDRTEALLTAERIRKTIEQYPFELPDGSHLHKTCSIGFACFPFLYDHPMALSWEQVIDIADHALYAAKKSGRNLSVGLAANSSTARDNLYTSISSNLPALIENQELTVITATDKPLVWK